MIFSWFYSSVITAANNPAACPDLEEPPGPVSSQAATCVTDGSSFLLRCKDTFLGSNSSRCADVGGAQWVTGRWFQQPMLWMVSFVTPVLMKKTGLVYVPTNASASLFMLTHNCTTSLYRTENRSRTRLQSQIKAKSSWCFYFSAGE